MAITAARELGFERIACASTGNLANSVAAHASRIGMPSIVFIPSDLEPAKIVQTAIYGGTLVGVHGSYDDVNRLCSELAETDEFESTGFVNVNVRPYYAEGSKTLGFEVAEQLGWRLPGQIVAPMASGSLLTKVHKAFKELIAAGLVPALRQWTVFGAQSAGCSPIATAFVNGWDVVQPVKPTGIAKSLNIGNPADGPYALDAVRSSGGAMAAVNDEEIREGIRLLARTTGVFGETAGGVTVAVLKKLVESGAIDRNVETVVFNTGDGLKTIDAVEDGARAIDRSHRAHAQGHARSRPALTIPAPPPRPAARCAHRPPTHSALFPWVRLADGDRAWRDGGPEADQQRFSSPPLPSPTHAGARRSASRPRGCPRSWLTMPGSLGGASQRAGT